MDEYRTELDQLLQDAARHVTAARGTRAESVRLREQVSRQRWSQRPDLVEEQALNDGIKDPDRTLEGPGPDAEKVLRRLLVDKEDD